ncbi:unnamed protein product [Paramecium sonneborni]|uniref:PSI domain-containing protein n=1 Tax=Paramecium sonneborni TaxID=65129 RepID=A0A8S1KU22_9CILI|nr:unnamed protein product [Paramecium sonneborni]
MRKIIQLLVVVIELVIGQKEQANTASYAAQQQGAMAAAIAQAAPYAAMGIPITIKPQTPPPPPDPPSIGTEPEPSEYNDLFTYSGYFDPYNDDVHAFMINGKRRKRHRVNCGRDRKGRYCDFRRSHHQHGLYNRDCIHYAGSLEIFGVWQCGSRKQLSTGAVIRFLVELHELVLAYKQQKNDYAIQRFQRVMEYNRDIYAKLKRAFKANIKKNIEFVMEILNKTNEQVIQNFQQILDMSKEILADIRQDREAELEELKSQLQELLENFPPPLSICQQLRDCDSCLSRDGCIWCTEEQNCQQGNSRDGAFFNSCDIWVSGQECPEEEAQYKLDNKVSYKNELEDYYNQSDLELDQKLYLASKQRDMIQLKNQIENRRVVIDQMISIERNLKQRSIQIIDEFSKNKQYDGDFLSKILDEDAEGQWTDYKQETKKLFKEDQEAQKELEAEELEQRKQQSEKDKKREEFEKKELEKRNESTVINKSKYKDRTSVEDVLEKEQGKLEKQEEK